MDDIGVLARSVQPRPVVGTIGTWWKRGRQFPARPPGKQRQVERGGPRADCQASPDLYPFGYLGREGVDVRPQRGDPSGPKLLEHIALLDRSDVSLGKRILDITRA